MGILKNIEKVLARILGVLDAFGILALAGVVGPLVLVALDIAAAVSEPKYSLIRDSISAWADLIGMDSNNRFCYFRFVGGDFHCWAIPQHSKKTLF